MRCWGNLLLLTGVILVLLLGSLSAGEPRILRNRQVLKQARAIRGFKGMPLQVSRGFGKRANDQDFTNDFTELAADTDGMTESFPLDWIANKMRTYPNVAKTVLRKFVDTNGDEQLTMDELLRPVY